MKPSEIIREGMKHVEAGWCKGKLEESRNVCAQGGVRRAAFGCAMLGAGPEIIQKEFDEFRQVLKAMDKYAVDHGFTNHTHLNDYGQFGMFSTVSKEFGRIPTTQQDVLTMMEKSAIALEETGQ